jgi:hypothetical protein
MTTFTLFHVFLSLVGILTGFVVLGAMIANKPVPGWTSAFVTTTLATVVTGFIFPVHRFMPSHAVGIVSLAALLVAVLARYVFTLSGRWRRAYSVAAVIALYLNVFVLVAQSFQKIPALHELAPSGTEAPFLLTQGGVLLLFIVLGIAAAKRFRGQILAL